ncbi:MAG TPA: PAS domain-containing protein [Balneolales bacterium]|nr:PAS domain-containing protein [Balneolales bacterium]
MKEILESQRHIIDAVLASIGEAVVIVNPKGRIIRNCNSATEEMFGFQKNELIGENTSILHINQQYYELFGNQSEAVLNRGEIFKGEFRMRKKMELSLIPTIP